MKFREPGSKFILFLVPNVNPFWTLCLLRIFQRPFELGYRLLSFIYSFEFSCTIIISKNNRSIVGMIHLIYCLKQWINRLKECFRISGISAVRVLFRSGYYLGHARVHKILCTFVYRTHKLKLNIIFPALVSTKVGSTNFSRVLAYSRTFAYCVLRTACCDFHPDPCSGTAKNHVCRPCAELLCQTRPLFQADPRRTHLRPSCEL